MSKWQTAIAILVFACVLAAAAVESQQNRPAGKSKTVALTEMDFIEIQQLVKAIP
jgi:hypothetical protein